MSTQETKPVMISNPLLEKNRVFYEALWSKTYLTSPARFNTWPLVSLLSRVAPQRLEIGPGLRPRLPVPDTYFVDLSPVAIDRLNAAQGFATVGEITALPFDADSFDLVAAFDVVEHVEDDRSVFAELTRVLKRGGILVFSVPLHAVQWNGFDDYVGHARRYEPAALLEKLTQYGLTVEKSAVFGMQSNNPRLLKWSVIGLSRFHSAAMRCYNWLFFPLGLLLQQQLRFTSGLMDLSEVHEVLLVCRKGPGTEKYMADGPSDVDLCRNRDPGG